jgi:hypothetical protein
MRGEAALPAIKLTSMVSGGYAFDSSPGRWLWAQAAAEHRIAQLSAYWLGYREEFDYSATGVQLQRDFKLREDAVIVRPVAGFAAWKSDSFSETYGVLGVNAEWNRPLRDVLFRLHGDAFTVGNNGYRAGQYGSLGLEAYYVFRGTTVGAGGVLSFNPVETEGGFNVWAGRMLNENLRIDAQVSRAVADPVYGSPGALGLSLIGSWRIHHRERAAAPVLATVGAPLKSGRVVKFTVQPPAHAKTVSVSGTFSDWRPIALKRDGKGWSGSVTVPAGTHQFGFLINGKEWFVPSDATDVIDDGFGRKNVTLVVRPK